MIKRASKISSFLVCISSTQYFYFFLQPGAIVISRSQHSQVNKYNWSFRKALLLERNPVRHGKKEYKEEREENREMQ